MTADLKACLDAAPCVLVEVTQARGSTPREQGAWMLVSPIATFGTIGGGQLEYMAIDKARQMLAGTAQDAAGSTTLSIPLGPEIGQCCGGRVRLALRAVDARLRASLLAAAMDEHAARPAVLVFGGGHVGHALASAFALLPVRVTVIDTRPDALRGMPSSVETRLTPVPEDIVRQALPGTAFVILTHDHALDFLIAAEALKRADAAYVGMIGSKTKRATFRNWFVKNAGGEEAALRRLVSPIGGDMVKDKRPSVIAALAAAEIMTALAERAGADARRPASKASAG